MKFVIILTSLLSMALSMALVPSSGKRITDEATLEKLRQSHNQTLFAMKSGKTIPIKRPQQDGLEERQIAEIVAGFFIAVIASDVEKIAVNIATQLGQFFYGNKQNQIWHNHKYCRTYFQTHGGGECEIRTYNKESGDATGTHNPDSGCAWTDTDPVVEYFEGDEGIGKYSVQFTATDGYNWDGIDGTEKCPFEGVCHPQYVFYRDGYNIVLNTWQNKGEVSKCQYSGGKDCGGICDYGVKDQFSTGGVKWGGDCAIPCEDDDKLPE